MSKKLYGNPKVELIKLEMILTESTEQGGAQSGNNFTDDDFGNNWLG